MDGGTTPDGLSYLVMEYVEGHAIDVYCDEHKLDIPARLQLFRKVCAAVEYAHQKHIIHRDLKPANILVTGEGTVKLLDFGIAKLMPGRDVESTVLMTRTGLRLMTPEYASPEQIRGEAVGAATDVYALGVVLYELLTGQLPYRLRSRIFHEIVRVICEEPPTRPSTAGESEDADRISLVRRTSPADLRKRLSGDLDGIVLKALEKQPYDRYRSASSFSDDIEQHLEGRPVVARQATLGYRAGKFMRRNLPWMILLAALAAAVATGGITINRTGAAVIGGCLVAAGLWYAATNRAIGRRIAESEFMFARFPTRGMSTWWLLCVWWLIGPHWPWIGAVSLAVVLAIAARQTVGWLGMRRAAGGLLVDLNNAVSVRNRWVLAAVLLLYFGVTPILGMFDLYSGVYVLCMPLLGFLGQRFEIRARGIAIAGTLYSWERIEACEWVKPVRRSLLALLIFPGPSEMMGKDWLRLRLRGGVQFLPPVQFPIPPGRRAEVDAIMSRYLSEWPADGRAADARVVSEAAVTGSGEPGQRLRH